MVMGRRKRGQQQEIWVATASIAKTPANPFYQKLNQLLREAKFDDRVEALCEPFYDRSHGRKGLAPGIYFRMLLIGFFEGISSERQIDWRCADSLSLRQFLGFALTESTPDHSTLSRTRQRLPLEIHREVFSIVLQMLADKGLLNGEGIAIDATPLLANAAMDAIVHKHTGLDYQEFLTKLAQESGIATPTKADLKRLDRQRDKKTSNADWHNPHDPDAKISKTPKFGTRMVYKAENAHCSGSGAILAPEIHPANEGDTATGPKTLERVSEELAKLDDALEAAILPASRLVADKGYFKSQWLTELEEDGFEPVIAEPKSPSARKWTDADGRKSAEKAAQQAAVVRNRARRQTEYGKRLRKRRAEFCERGFAHLCGSGGLRRVWLRGLDNVRKRYEIHCAGFNLGLLMRHLTGLGTPRGLQSASAATLAAFATLFLAIVNHLHAAIRHLTTIRQTPLPIHRHVCRHPIPAVPVAGAP